MTLQFKQSEECLRHYILLVQKTLWDSSYEPILLRNLTKFNEEQDLYLYFSDPKMSSSTGTCGKDKKFI